jgi:hypothetical protein
MTQDKPRRDNELAGDIVFYVDDYKFLIDGLKLLRDELQKFLPVKKEFGLERTEFDRQLERISHIIEHVEPKLNQDRRGPLFEYSVSWGSLRILKAGGMFALRQLQERRDKTLAKYPNLPLALLSAIDGQISEAQNRVEMGVLNGLEPADILFETLRTEISQPLHHISAPQPSMPAHQVPLHLNRIPILDSELRDRVLPLILPIADGVASGEELDKAVREMSVILEDRVRTVADLKGQHLEGVKLMAAAFAGEQPRLVISQDVDVQTSAHHLYRGYSGFVRNEVMHRLVKTYTVERVLQLLGFVDYLLSLLTQAKAPSKQADHSEQAKV